MSRLRNTTAIGLFIGVAFVVGSVIVTGEPVLFWNLPSAFIIFGGTLGVVITAFPLHRLKTFGSVVKRSFKRDSYDLKNDILVLIKFSEISRRDGILALEDYADQFTEDDFIKKGIQLIVDGADEEQLRNLLEGSTYFMKQRHQKGASMIELIASTAPALGLLGTYVGLIPMLNNLDDPTKLGPMMALELVSSFYGAFIAYVIFAPMARKLKFMNKEEESRRELLIEGLAAIHQGKNPKLIKEELSAYANIDPNTLDTIEENEQEQTTFKTKEMASQS